MKRRTFGLMASTSAFALKFGPASAASAVDPSLLGTTLTPVGAEKAGNADGSIPAWTGGYTTLPSGWQPGQFMPDFFADEQPVVVVDASNVAAHSDRLSDGVVAMINKYGFKVKVFPTHRTAAAPQFVYDNTKQNATTATFIATGGRFGFTNAFAGVPFPIPDASDPETAGLQIIWNHNARWWASAMKRVSAQAWIVSGGGAPVAPYQGDSWFDWPYYIKTPSTFEGILLRKSVDETGPPTILGTLLLLYNLTGGSSVAWSVLPGQGRVRRAPELYYDTPASQTAGIANYDEFYGFDGAPDRYDWKLLGKKEMYIPYNCNGLPMQHASEVHGPHFLDPEVVRWELHRTWVIEATLHPGQRNVLARRRYLIDEDTWSVAVGDAYDADGNLYKHTQLFNWVRPDIPGTPYLNSAVYNLQTDDYVTMDGVWDQKDHPSVYFVKSFPESIFSPEQMAARTQF